MFVRSGLASLRRALRLRCLAPAVLLACGQLGGQAPAEGPAAPPAEPLVIARPGTPGPAPRTILRCVAPGDLGKLPPPEEPPKITPVQLAPAAPTGGLPASEEGEAGLPQFPISLQPPGPQRVFSRESEANLQERIRQSDHANLSEPIQFPPEPVLARPGEKVERRWPSQPELAEPNYVCHGPIFHEQLNFERYGWDLEVLAPFVSLGTFWYDVAVGPYRLVTATTEHTWCGGECSAGYCLPGNPVPLLIYPPHWPITIEFDDGRGSHSCAPCGAMPGADKK